jgi:Secretion system C-terminal sorting domain
MKRIILFFFFAAAILPGLAYAAPDTLDVASDNPPQEGNLNTAVENAIAGGTLSSTVFRLEAGGYYVLTSTINVPAGKHLTIVAPEPTSTTAPPQIVWTTSGSPDQTYNFNCYGGITLKNIWLMYADASGNQVKSKLSVQEDTTLAAGEEEHANFENVIFSYSGAPINGSSGAVEVSCKHFNGKFVNCYFKNCVDSHLRYYGRAVSFAYNTTGWHIDSVSFENCTFANLGYVLMQEGGEYSDYVKANHCTFINVVMFPFESSWWHDLIVTNSLFQNCWMFGSIPANDTSGANGGILAVDSVKNFGFTPDPLYTDQQRHVLFAHCSYLLDPWLIDWMHSCPYSVRMHQQRQDDFIPVPQPFLNGRSWYFFDSLDAVGNKLFPFMTAFNFDTTDNPLFLVPPTDTTVLKIFMDKKWDDNTDTNWAWMPQNDVNAQWPLEENLAYQNTTLKTFAMGGFPLGDLYRWWPTEYATWQAQSAAENDSLTTWLMNGRVLAVKQRPGPRPIKYELAQNYPNPFNPTTNINYTVPRKGFVTLRVYNVLGQEVATLFSGVQNAGNYVASFNAARFASGVYFYRLQSGNVSITKKLMLMK